MFVGNNYTFVTLIMAATGLHISISAESVLNIGGLAITNSMFTSLIVSAILILFALTVRMQLTNTSKPKGLQNFAEWIIEALHSLIYSTTGDLKKTRLFLPIISTFFLFIILNNWIGLLPGVGTITVPAPSESAGAQHTQETQQEAQVETKDNRGGFLAVQAEEIAHAGEDHDEVGQVLETEDGHAPQQETHETDGEHAAAVPILRPGSADLNTTIALAIISVALTQVYGLQFQSLGYLKKFINFSSPIMFFVGILELISEFAKIISFAFRLFGNIFAGEVLLVVISALVPIIVPMPFYGLELFVGFIQALVFSMLSLVFFNMATQGHDNH